MRFVRCSPYPHKIFLPNVTHATHTPDVAFKPRPKLLRKWKPLRKYLYGPQISAALPDVCTLLLPLQL